MKATFTGLPMNGVEAEPERPGDGCLAAGTRRRFAASKSRDGEEAGELKLRMAFLALVTSLSVSVAGCGASKLQPVSTSAARHPVSARHGKEAGCPRGRLLPGNAAVAIDYVDFLRFNGRSYDGTVTPIRASLLGRIVTRVRCSLIAEQDQRRGEPPIIDRTASFLPVGAAVYAVRGYPASCRLAAYLNGKPHAYLAQATGRGRTAATPTPCAVRRPATG